MTQAISSPSSAQSDRRRWVALVVVCLAMLMNALDGSIVNVALPSIQRSLHFTPANLTWVVDAYPGKGAHDPTLKTIQPALNSFAANLGPSHFVASHYLTAVSDADAEAQVSPTPGESLEYRVTPTEGGVVLDFNYRNRGTHLNGKVTTKLNQNLVLGLVSERPDGKGPGSIHRLLVIRIVPANQG